MPCSSSTSVRRRIITPNEPSDLDDLPAHDALDAVIADIREHRIAGGPGGFFTALRHIELLGHLAIRLAGDAHHHLDQKQNISSTRHSAKTLSQTAGHVGRALAHYTQALTPLAVLAQPGVPITLDRQLGAIDRHRDLHAYLSHAHQALDEARASLAGLNPVPQAQSPTPLPPIAARASPHPPRR